MEAVITLEDVSFSYGGHPALENVNLSLARNDFAGIIGPNGGGKTTLLRIMLGLLKPESGNVRVLGHAPEMVRKQLAYVPQYSALDRDFPLSVRGVVAMGLLDSRSFFPRFSREEYRKVDEALRSVGIGNLAEKNYGELSGGQQQRCLIARAIVTTPQILLLDEPTASVDSSAEKDIYELLRSFNREMTIVLVSHDIGFISSYINKVVCINRRLVSHLTGEITADHLKHEVYKSDMTIIQHKCNL